MRGTAFKRGEELRKDDEQLKVNEEDDDLRGKEH